MAIFSARGMPHESGVVQADTTLNAWLQLIRAEDLGTPGLCLTEPQVRRDGGRKVLRLLLATFMIGVTVPYSGRASASLRDSGTT